MKTKTKKRKLVIPRIKWEWNGVEYANHRIYHSRRWCLIIEDTMCGKDRPHLTFDLTPLYATQLRRETQFRISGPRACSVKSIQRYAEGVLYDFCVLAGWNYSEQ